MSEFNVGDVVEVSDGGNPAGNFSGLGKIVQIDRLGWPIVKGPGDAVLSYPPERVTRVGAPQFVNVTTSRSIWVTLPGDNAGHKLTEDEARTLFRQLEEVI